MLTAIVLVRDETESLKTCLRSLEFTDTILVIADNPTFRTLAILKTFPVRVINHTLKNDFAAHRNFALTAVKTEWALFVDADENVSLELAGNISRIIKDSRVQGCLIHRLDSLWGRTLKHGDLSGIDLLRLARVNAGHWVGRVHETWQISGQVQKISGDLIHTPHPTLFHFIQSINFYSTIRAGELAGQGNTSVLWQIVSYPLGKFVYLWIFKLGFLDGIRGLIHALVMSFYSFLVRGKLYLLNRETGV